MRKKLLIVLSVIALAASFAACGKTTEPTDTTPTTAVTDQSDPSATLTPAEAPTTAPTTAPTEAPTTAPTEAPTTAPTAEPLPTPTPAPTATPRPDISDVSLKELYKDYFMIGTIYTPAINSGADHELVKQHFNAITPENNMKPDSVQHVEGVFTYSEPDYMVELASQCGWTVIGHNLAWHQQSPNWMGNSAESREEAIEQLKTHIYNVAGHYKGQIYSWDVLNEAIADGAKLPDDGDWTKCLRETQWTKSIGPDYVAMAFQFAHEADPDALLYYNDYNMNDKNKAEIAAAMVADLRSQGVPIHGIGMQGHYSTDTPLGSVRNGLEILSQVEGIKLSITELDVGVSGSNGALSEAAEKKQALFYAKLFNLYKEYADVIERVTFWGYRDDRSWRKENCPVIFNKDLSPKEALYALMDPDAYIAAAEAETAPAPARKVNAVLTETAPVIDGEKDPVWLQKTMPYKINTPLFAWQGASGTVRILWDEKHVYALFEVEDSVLNTSSPNMHEQDSIELFLDEQNTKRDYYTDAAGQYRVNCEGVLSFGTVPTENGVTAAAKKTAKGYIVEIAVPLTGTASAGMVFGFEAQINDSNESGVRQSVMKFYDATDNSYTSTAGWGELLLKEK